MYCKICGKEGHYATECDRYWNSRGSDLRDGVENGRDVSLSRERRSVHVLSEKGDTSNGQRVRNVSNRFAKWKAANRSRYNEYMREYMRKRRGK